MKLYEIARWLLSLYNKLFRRVEVTGIENIPKDGSIFIIANHCSNLDPLVLMTLFDREIHYMAKNELFEIPIFGKLLRMNYVFSVKRGELDRNAIKTAMKLLKDGNILGVFPEGTRNTGKSLLPFKPGVAFIASRQETMILPIGVVGATNMFKFWKPPVKIKIGKVYSSKIPGDYSNKEVMSILLEKQIKSIEELVYDKNGKILLD